MCRSKEPFSDLGLWKQTLKRVHYKIKHKLISPEIDTTYIKNKNTQTKTATSKSATVRCSWDKYCYYLFQQICIYIKAKTFVLSIEVLKLPQDNITNLQTLRLMYLQ